MIRYDVKVQKLVVDIVYGTVKILVKTGSPGPMVSPWKSHRLSLEMK